MRIHASGVGRTLSDALDKAGEELKTQALHAHEITEDMWIVKDGKPFLPPAKARVENKMAGDMEQALVKFGQLVDPVDGYLFRVLVAASSNDGERSHFSLSIDLFRG